MVAYQALVEQTDTVITTYQTKLTPDLARRC